MKRAVIPLLIWATLLAGAAIALWLYSHHQRLAVAMLAGASIVTYVIAIGFAIRHWRTPDASEAREHPEIAVRALPDLSFGAALVGIAIATIVFGVEFGLFLVLIGAGLLLLGVGRLIVEIRGERRAERELVP